MDKKTYQSHLNILRSELVPALGCTEPIAIAYAAAKARAVLGVMPQSLEIVCSGNIIKNVKGVTVPNSNGMKGIDAAAVLGTLGGNAERELEVLESVTPEHIARAKELIQSGYCTCRLQEDVENLFIRARAVAGGHWAEVTVINRHTFIARIVRDGAVLFEHDICEDTPEAPDKSILTVESILNFAECADTADVQEILDRQIAMNTAISDVGLAGGYGAEVGKTLLRMCGTDVRTRARARAAAGSDARMGGCALPVVINSGSGNQGMTVSLPVIEFAKELGASREQLYRALIISNLVSIHQKSYIGSLSAYCGAVSAACGAGAAITYLYGGGYQEISDTIVNTVANVSGIVCDGAKPSCAAKIASAVDAAILAHYLSCGHHRFSPGEGFVQENLEDTIKSVGYIGRVGMKSTDTEILNLMINQVDLA